MSKVSIPITVQVEVNTKTLVQSVNTPAKASKPVKAKAKSKKRKTRPSSSLSSKELAVLLTSTNGFTGLAKKFNLTLPQIYNLRQRLNVTKAPVSVGTGPRTKFKLSDAAVSFITTSPLSASAVADKLKISTRTVQRVRRAADANHSDAQVGVR